MNIIMQDFAVNNADAPCSPHNTVRHYIQSYRIRHCLKLLHQIIPCVTGSLCFIRLEFLFVRSSPKVFLRVNMWFDETFAMNCQIWTIQTPRRHTHIAQTILKRKSRAMASTIVPTHTIQVRSKVQRIFRHPRVRVNTHLSNPISYIQSTIVTTTACTSQAKTLEQA